MEILFTTKLACNKLCCRVKATVRAHTGSIAAPAPASTTILRYQLAPPAITTSYHHQLAPPASATSQRHQRQLTWLCRWVRRCRCIPRRSSSPTATPRTESEREGESLSLLQGPARQGAARSSEVDESREERSSEESLKEKREREGASAGARIERKEEPRQAAAAGSERVRRTAARRDAHRFTRDSLSMTLVELAALA